MNASAVGRQAPRPRPARNRSVVNAPTLGAHAVAIVSTENQATHAIRLRRRPKRSVTGPISVAPIPTPTSPIVDAVGRLASVNPSAPVLLIVGITAPITTRSKPSRATASQHRATGQSPTEAGVRRSLTVAEVVEVDMVVPSQEWPHRAPI